MKLVVPTFFVLYFNKCTFAHAASLLGNVLDFINLYSNDVEWNLKKTSSKILGKAQFDLFQNFS